MLPAPIELPNYQLAIFDLDGVLLDSKANMQESWKAVRQQIGTPVPFESYFSEIGKPFHDIMDTLGLGGQAREAEHIYMRTSLANNHLLRWFAGIEDMLTQLQDREIKLAIVTSKDRQRTVRLTERLPVSFSTIQSPTQGLRGKPAPDQLLIACAHANVDPEHALFVGDMSVDQQAAGRARIDFAHATWGYGEVDGSKAIRLTGPDDVLEAVFGK